MSQKSYDNSPSVFIIPTPIGNYDDITYRALNVLKMVDSLFCEDTRVTSQLLKHFAIKKKLYSSHEYNEAKMVDVVIGELKLGRNVGIVTDQGTPIISDPGFLIVNKITELGYNVISLPGATALIPALTSSGISAMSFLFFGFLNAKSSKRIKELESLKREKSTLVFYEAPHRIIEVLNDMFLIFGNRRIAISREISKIHEEIYRGNLKDMLNITPLKGEFVIVVAGSDEEDYSSLSLIEHVDIYTNDGLAVNEAIKKVAKERGIAKSIVYKEYIDGGGRK